MPRETAYRYQRPVLPPKSDYHRPLRYIACAGAVLALMPWWPDGPRSTVLLGIAALGIIGFGIAAIRTLVRRAQGRRASFSAPAAPALEAVLARRIEAVHKAMAGAEEPWVLYRNGTIALQGRTPELLPYDAGFRVEPVADKGRLVSFADGLKVYVDAPDGDSADTHATGRCAVAKARLDARAPEAVATGAVDAAAAIPS